VAYQTSTAEYLLVIADLTASSLFAYVQPAMTCHVACLQVCSLYSVCKPCCLTYFSLFVRCLKILPQQKAVTEYILVVADLATRVAVALSAACYAPIRLVSWIVSCIVGENELQHMFWVVLDMFEVRCLIRIPLLNIFW
jgi:hypothetical protein